MQSYIKFSCWKNTPEKIAHILRTATGLKCESRLTPASHHHFYYFNSIFYLNAAKEYVALARESIGSGFTFLDTSLLEFLSV